MTNRQKVLQAVIKSLGIVVNIRHMVKKIRKNHDTNSKGKIYDMQLHKIYDKKKYSD